MIDKLKALFAESIHIIASKLTCGGDDQSCSASRIDEARVTSTKLKALDPANKPQRVFKPEQALNDESSSEPRMTIEQVKKSRKELTQNRLEALSSDHIKKSK